MPSRTPSLRAEYLPDMSTLTTAEVSRIVDTEADVYGYGNPGRGYGEYTACSNFECGRVRSINEVYGIADSDADYVPLDELEKDGPKLDPCESCGCETFKVFHPDAFVPYLQELFKKGFGAVLYDEQGIIQGSTFGVITTFGDAFDNDVNYRTSENPAYDKGFHWPTLQERGERILGHPVTADTPIFNFNRVSIRHGFRGGGNFRRLMATAFGPQMADHGHLPSMGATMADSGLAPHLWTGGYENVEVDGYGSILTLVRQIETFHAAMACSRDEYRAQYGAVLQANKARAERMIAQSPPKGAVHYRYNRELANTYARIQALKAAREG